MSSFPIVRLLIHAIVRSLGGDSRGWRARAVAYQVGAGAAQVTDALLGMVGMRTATDFPAR